MQGKIHSRKHGENQRCRLKRKKAMQPREGHDWVCLLLEITCYKEKVHLSTEPRLLLELIKHQIERRQSDKKSTTKIAHLQLACKTDY